jgi:hypothetical protein
LNAVTQAFHWDISTDTQVISRFTLQKKALMVLVEERTRQLETSHVTQMRIHITELEALKRTGYTCEEMN